jgi:hypothetical protein
MSYFYIYKMTHPETGEFYIGRRTSNKKPSEDISYRGSSITWYKNLNKVIINEILIKEILVENLESQEELNEIEIKWISENIKNPLCMNAHIPNVGFYTSGPMSEHSKKKMSIASKGKRKSEEHCKNIKERIISEETRNKMSKSKLNMSDETKKKLSESQKGRKPTIETRKKLSESKIGHTVSEETRLKMSKAKIGQIVSDETRKKLSDAAKNRNHTEESKIKMSKAKIGHVMSEETKKKISESIKRIRNEKRINEN